MSYVKKNMKNLVCSIGGVIVVAAIAVAVLPIRRI